MKKLVTQDNLVALGAGRLAAILVELADDDAEIKRRLRLELAAQDGGDAIAAGVAKELPVVVKSDVQGSLEAIVGALEKLATDFSDTQKRNRRKSKAN